MESKVVRVHVDALKAAKSYHKDVSTAILLMNERIKILEKEVIDKKTMAKIVKTSFSEALQDLSKKH